MASLIQPGADEGYVGLADIFEFTNADGELWLTNCGQAACATLVTHYAPLSKLAEKGPDLLSRLESAFPPDNLGGLFGTSSRRVRTICKAYGLRVKTVDGENLLRAHLAAQTPVVVMLSVPAGRLFGWQLYGGHWMVAYGYDDQHIYLTNWGRMPWPEFRAGWAGLVPRLISMRNRGLAVSPDDSPQRARRAQRKN